MAALLSSKLIVLEHLHTVDVNLVTIDVSGHGNMVPIVLLKSVRIIDRQDLLVGICDDYWRGPGSDALFRACFSLSVGPLNATFRVTDPPIDSLRISGKRYRSHQQDQSTGKYQQE